MKFGKKSVGAVAAGLSLVMALSPVAALADTPTVNITEGVTKVLQLNSGSTVNATFKYTAKPTVLNGANGSPSTETHNVSATIEDITINNTADSANKETTKTGAITYGEFPHAGTYAWTVQETSGTYEGVGNMSYDKQIYTLVAVVENNEGTTGTHVAQSYLIEGKATTTSGKKVGTATFTNTYVETPSNTQDGTDLTITKLVEGPQADKTANNKFHFVVQFTAPTYTNDWKLADIKATGANVNATSETGKFEFDAANADAVNFENVLVGATYTVTETQNADYEGKYTVGTDTTAVVTGEKGADVTASNVAITEGAVNTGTMTNTKESTVVTGLIVNNAPFIVMIGVAAAGVAAYGTAKRKLEK